MKKYISTHIKTVNPTVAENIAAGYNTGQEWINTTTGEKFYHKTDGVWETILSISDISIKEDTANKQNNLNYDGTTVKFPTVDGVNDWARKVAKIATKTGLLSKLDTFNLITLTTTVARIEAVEGCVFWNELFVAGTSPSSAIKSFAQKDYNLTELVTATGGNVNLNPLTTDGLYIRYLGYDKDGNVYSSTNSLTTNNDIFQIGYVTVLKTGGVVTFLGGTTPGARNVFPQPNLASNTDFDKIASISTDVSVAANASASFKTLSGTIAGISINWKSLSNPINANPIDVVNYTGLTTPTFASIDPLFLTQTSAPTAHTLWTELEGGIAINNSFFNTTTGLRGTMANGTASIKRVLLGLRGGIFLQEGEHASTAAYSDLTTAKNNIFNHTFSNAIIPPGVVIEIARIAYIKGATDLSNTSQAYIVSTSGSGGAGANTIADTTQSVYNNSSTPEIVTDSTRGAFTLRRGSAADTDNIYEGQNGAGTIVYSVDGNGKITGTSIVKSGALAGQHLMANGTVSVGYKVYTALISQSGTSSPTATVLENTLGDTITWTRTVAGAYLGTLGVLSTFTNNKTVAFVTPLTQFGSSYPQVISLGRNDDSSVYLFTALTDSTQTKIDEVLFNTTIEIRVYN